MPINLITAKMTSKVAIIRLKYKSQAKALIDIQISTRKTIELVFNLYYNLYHLKNSMQQNECLFLLQDKNILLRILKEIPSTCSMWCNTELPGII